MPHLPLAVSMRVYTTAKGWGILFRNYEDFCTGADTPQKTACWPAAWKAAHPAPLAYLELRLASVRWSASHRSIDDYLTVDEPLWLPGAGDRTQDEPTPGQPLGGVMACSFTLTTVGYAGAACSVALAAALALLLSPSRDRNSSVTAYFTNRVSKPVLPFAEPFLTAERSWVLVPPSASPWESISRHPALRVRSRACTLPEASR